MGIELLIILTTMSNKKKRFILPEEAIPQYWYNIQADMVNKPMPPLHPGTKQPLKAEDLYPIFAEELCRQELNQTDTWIEIPEEVREMYKYYRSTPLVRAYGLEKALGSRRFREAQKMLLNFGPETDNPCVNCQRYKIMKETKSYLTLEEIEAYKK